MEFAVRNLWVLWLAVLLGCTAAAEQITVQVHNTAAVSPSVLTRGESEAGRILRHAGIEVVWLNCANSSSVGERCFLADDPAVFVLHIVSQGKTSTDSVFGEAFLGEGGVGKYCDIFFGRMLEAFRDSGANLADLLGAVAAHELGHLLLGSYAHSQIGIMEPVWQKESLRAIQMGTLLFTPDQAGAMRARLKRPVLKLARVRPGI